MVVLRLKIISISKPNEMEQMNYGLKCKHKISHTHTRNTYTRERTGMAQKSECNSFSVFCAWKQTNQRANKTRQIYSAASKSNRSTGKNIQSHTSFYYLLCVLTTQSLYTLCVFSYFYSKISVSVCAVERARLGKYYIYVRLRSKRTQSNWRCHATYYTQTHTHTESEHVSQRIIMRRTNKHTRYTHIEKKRLKGK